MKEIEDIFSPGVWLRASAGVMAVDMPCVEAGRIRKMNPECNPPKPVKFQLESP